jgi:hypothetical protein
MLDGSSEAVTVRRSCWRETAGWRRIRGESESDARASPEAPVDDDASRADVSVSVGALVNTAQRASSS